MATTLIPDPKPVHPDITTDYVLSLVHSWYKQVMGDVDKAGDPMDHEFYLGTAEALESVMIVLTNEPDNHLVYTGAQIATKALPLIRKGNIPFLIGLALHFVP